MSLTKTYISRHKGRLLGALGLGLFSYALTIAIPLCIGKFYQLAFHGGSARGNLFDRVFGNVTSIETLLIIFAALISVRFILQWSSQYYTAILGEKFSAYLRETVFEKQLRTTTQAFEQKAVGKYLLRYSGDLSSAQQFLTKGVIGFSTDLAFLIMTTVLFFYLDIQLTWYVLLSLPVIYLVSLAAQSNLQAPIERKRAVRAQNLSFVSERLHAFTTIKVLNRITPETEKYQKRSGEQYSASVPYHIRNSFANALYPFLLYAMLGGIMYAAFQNAKNNNIAADGSTLIVFIMLIIQMIPVYKRLLRSGAIRRAGNVSLSKINEMMAAPEEPLEKTRLDLSSTEITFDRVSFDYGTVPVLSGFTARIPERGITLISGEQGSGKSTLCKLITGIYQPHSGSIYIGGHAYDTQSIFSVRRHITMASRDLPLLGRTVFEVISYSRDKDKKERALQVLAATGFCSADDKAALSMPVREGGKNFSEGERQLLRIARAVLSDKAVMVFDEPFEGLDQSAITTICHLLNELALSHSIIVIGTGAPKTLDINHRIQLTRNNQPTYA